MGEVFEEGFVLGCLIDFKLDIPYKTAGRISSFQPRILIYGI